MRKPSHARSIRGALALAGVLAGCTNQATRHSTGSGAQAPLAAELEPLQGQWDGEGAGGPCSITIRGDSLRYRNSAGWYRTTFTVTAGVEPRQLTATIRECSPPSDKAVGAVIFAIFKVEGGRLLLAEDDGSDRPPKTFAGASSRYTLRHVGPPKEKVAPAPPTGAGTQ